MLSEGGAIISPEANGRSWLVDIVAPSERGFGSTLNLRFAVNVSCLFLSTKDVQDINRSMGRIKSVPVSDSTTFLSRLF